MRPFRITERISNDDSDSLKKYFAEIKKYKILTAEQEVGLAQRIHEGDREALEALVNANLRFVVTVAKQYENKGLLLPDLINEGNIGLYTAAEKFDETQGFRFLSYAVWWIRESILKALSETGRTIRLPKGQVDLIGKINKTISEFQNENGRAPSESEIADILGVIDKSVINAINASARTVSIDAPRSEDDDRDYLETVDVADSETADDRVIDESVNQEIRSILSVLPPNEQYIIGHLFGIGYEKMSVDEIAEKMKKPKLRIQQMKVKAIRHLRERTKNKKLKRLLENL